MQRAVVVIFSLSVLCWAEQPLRSTKCAPNQVINRMTVYDDGALEAECGPLPCGTSGPKCIDNQLACRAETDVFSGMSWAHNGQSVLLRCCVYSLPKKIYVGTDLVTAGSYYVGGMIAEKDKYGSAGDEYDYVTNIRTEQGGVRVWVYRVMCDKKSVAPTDVPSNDIAPSPIAVAAAQVPTPIGGGNYAKTEQERQAAFEARRKYLLERLSGKAEKEEEEEAEEEDGDEENTQEEQQQETRPSPLQYKPSSRRSTGVNRH